MGLRQWVHERPLAGAAVAAALIAAVIVWTAQRSRPDRTSYKQAWYYDLGAARLFAHDTAAPPVDAPSGKQGVLAYVYACKACGDESDRFIAWLETYTDEATRLLGKPVPAGETRIPKEKAVIDAGRMIAGVPDGGEPRWVRHDSPEGEAIRDALRKRCSTFPIPCMP